MTSGGTFPNRLTEVDDLTRPDHSYLTEDDHCYFIGEYTARQGFAYSATNSLILNFKKTLDRRGRPEWRYKERALQTSAAAFRRALNPEALDGLTFVPVPPSKAKGDPLYDDRLTRMLRAIRPEPPLDDLPTTGAHFRAAKSILSARFPEVAVVGMFIARQAPHTADLEEFDDVEF